MVSMAVKERIEVRRLVGSSTQLVVHLSRCEICREAGTRYCEEVEELMEVVRADHDPITSDLSAS